MFSLLSESSKCSVAAVQVKPSEPEVGSFDGLGCNFTELTLVKIENRILKKNLTRLRSEFEGIRFNNLHFILFFFFASNFIFT